MSPTQQRSHTPGRPSLSACCGSRIAALALFLAAACSSSEAPTALGADDGILFITQVQAPAVHMEALFDGLVVADQAGCLRLSSPDPATVIWPHGFTRRGSEVRNDRGGRVGRIGGSFRLGGGEVPMHEGLGFSAADMERIQTRCPGKYWHTGEIPR